jgi:hypothetical protein
MEEKTKAFLKPDDLKKILGHSNTTGHGARILRRTDGREQHGIPIPP